MLSFDRELFRRSFNRQPFRVEHDLSDHPLFEFERLIGLSRALPADQIEYNAGDLPVTQDAKQTPRTGLSATETIRRIEECRSWMALKNVQMDAEYRQLALRTLEPVRAFCHDLRGLEAFIFISSPNAVTPFHIDPECNFLLQIRGAKTIRTFLPSDRSIVSEEQLERFYAGGSRNLLELPFDAERAATTFELAAGQGVHVPVTSPHWVRNGKSVSISFSVTFRTDASDRREIAYRVNHRLRRLHLRPRAVGASKAADDRKYAVFDLARRTAHALGAIRARKRKALASNS